MSDVRQTLSEKDARELSDTLLSDHQMSAQTDTYTSNTDLIAQIPKLLGFGHV